MSNYLLDLLNHSGAQSSPSPSAAPAPVSTSSTSAQWPQSSNGNASPAHQQDMGSAQSGNKSGVTSPQPSSSAASFLQTLLNAPLSPSVAKTQQQQQPSITDARSPSAQHSNPTTASAASGLLALLSGPSQSAATSPPKTATGQAALDSGDATPIPAAGKYPVALYPVY